VEAYLNDVVELPDGSFWLGSAKGLFRFDPASGRSIRQPLHPDAPSWQTEQVRSLLVDRSGGLWVGTLGGLFHHDPHLKRFRHWQHDSRDDATLSAEPVSQIVAGPDGALWIGTFGGGLNRVDPASGRAERFRHDPEDPDSLPAELIWSLAWDSEGQLWVGASITSVFDPRQRRFERSELPPDSPRSIHTDGRGRVWLGTYAEGLFVHDLAGGGWRRLPEMQTIQIAPSASGALWIGQRGAVSRLDPATLEAARFPLTAGDGSPLADVEVFDLYESEEELWLATSAGLGRLDPERGGCELPVASEELPGTVVFSIQPDGRGRLWLGTNQGLAVFDRAAAQGHQVRVYDRADGVGNLEFNRRSRYRAPDGTLYLGGMNGVTVFHPDEIRDNPYVPPVVLTGVRRLRRGGERRIDPHGLGRLELEPGTSEVTFSFTALSFTRTERNRYAYRLEGLDGDWIDAGAVRSARYTNVPPGSYLFRVRASNNDGVWNEAGVALPVVVRPSYWQTLWFRLLVLAAIAALLAGAYRFRVRRLIELERVRLRIAGDLHDQLGSELSGIALAASRVAAKEYLEEGDRRRLEDVRSSSVQATQDLRDIVWYVNPDHDGLHSMEARMRSAAAILLGGLEARFELELPGDGRGLDMVTRRNLYLIYKELLTNVARHARAQRVRIRLLVRDRDVLLEVEDDGEGFDSAAPTDGSGLASVRRRAANMKARLDLDARPGEGTRVRVRAKITRTRQSRGRAASTNLSG
jgi:signal transduction histidine kinase